MAQPPLLTLSDIRLSFGGKPLFTGASVSISKGERAALVGRNGAGKSTLMKIVSGRIEPDEGDVWIQPGTAAVFAEQEPNLSGFETVREYAAHGLEDAFRADAELTAFGIPLDAETSTLSGGQARRAALARAFAHDPDILLLDEPTNHLDVPMIEALEDRLKAFKGAVLLVSHDRRFLEEVSTRTLWLRGGIVRKSERGFKHFDDWAGEIEAEEERRLEKLKTQLKDETRWLARGVTARRKRNQGRLAKLTSMRAEHARRRSELGQSKATAGLSAETSDQASRKIIDVRGLSKTFDTPQGPLKIAEDLTLRILRGDRIGIVGPNGAGKTTLVRLLLGELAPDSGSVKLSQNAQIAFLDQLRGRLKPNDTLWETLAPQGGDQIMVQGKARHVAAYAKDFLFPPEVLRQPVGAMSGGERNRLTLALALAQPSNLLVLDEPTNDLDMQTLDLLEDMLNDYEGTLILVSHDRAFLDQTVSACLTSLGDGRWIETPGGWTDAQSQLSTRKDAARRVSDKPKPKKDTPAKSTVTKPQVKLSFKDTHRLKEIDEALPRLTAEIDALEGELADPNLFAQDPDKFAKASARLEAARREKDQAEEDWLEIETKREALEAGV
ncbi:MAG: ATP-binding cassette domain-containing protein [Pseudomonadota bacterium]